MRLIAAALLLAALFPAAGHTPPEPHQFAVTRAISIAPGDSPRACFPLDGPAYAHAQPALADLRLFAGKTEIPYALTMSETAPSVDPAKIVNRGLRGRHIVFDLAMPARPYTHIDLDINAENFLATARVSGLRSLPEAGSGVSLGSFTLFDLSQQDLARDTTLPLSESNFPYIHVDLEFLDSAHNIGDLDPSIIRAAAVPPSREAETVYTPVVAVDHVVQRGRESVATFQVPPHVPIERVSFVIASSGPATFSREVSLRAKAVGDANAMREEVTGQISRVQMIEQGQKLHLEALSVPATIGSNGQTDANIEVSVDNGDDQPLAITSVRLDMRERKLCFDAPEVPVDLFYGDPTLDAPVYDYSRLFSPAAPARTATLFGETNNPLYQPPAVIKRPLTERHPELLWIALLGVAAVLGTIAFFSARRV